MKNSDTNQWRSQPKFWGGPNLLTLSKQQYFV